jgi:pimeloyl-[acyl-carrier protein] methyl ester esterase
MKLCVERSGTGPALVLWHGWGLNLRIFDGLRDALASEFEIIAVDLPGHGASQWLAGMDGEAQLSALLQSVPEGAALLGWSLGGQFALRAALRSPAQISRLILIATTPRFTNGAAWSYGLDAAVLDGFALRLRADWAGTVQDFLELQVRGGAESGLALSALRAALDAHGRGDPAALGAGLELLANTDLRPLLPTLETPTLVMCGERDRIAPPAASRVLAQALPHAQYLAFARAAHTPFLTDPSAVAHAVREFLHPLAAKPGVA